MPQVYSAPSTVTPASPSGARWAACWHAASSRTYYHDETSGVTQWERPLDYMGTPAVPTQPAAAGSVLGTHGREGGAAGTYDTPHARRRIGGSEADAEWEAAVDRRVREMLAQTRDARQDAEEETETGGGSQHTANMMTQGFAAISDRMTTQLAQMEAQIQSRLGERPAHTTEDDDDATRLLGTMGMTGAGAPERPRCSLNIENFSCRGPCTAVAGRALGYRFCVSEAVREQAKLREYELKEFTKNYQRNELFLDQQLLNPQHSNLASGLARGPGWTSDDLRDPSPYDKRMKKTLEKKSAQLDKDMTLIMGESRYGGMGDRRDGAQTNLALATQAGKLRKTLGDAQAILEESLGLLRGEGGGAAGEYNSENMNRVVKNVSAASRAIAFMHDLVAQGELGQMYEVHKVIAKTRFEQAMKTKVGAESCMAMLDMRARGGAYEGPVGSATPTSLGRMIGQILKEQRDNKVHEFRDAGAWQDDQEAQTRAKKGGGASGRSHHSASVGALGKAVESVAGSGDQ